MPKALCIFGMVVAILVFAVFTLDVATQFPFQGHSMMMDIGSMIAAAVLGYISFMTFREQV